MSSYTSIACYIEAPNAFVPKARWALEALLGPLGLAPIWVARDGLAEGGIYYGPAVAHLPERTVAIPLHPATTAFFDGGERYDPNAVAELTWDGDRWPVLFPQAEAATPDLIASAFYWLSGWQEVTTTERDVHGRFPYHASLQAALGCVLRPVVDVYRNVLAERLGAEGVPIRRWTWQGQTWAVVMTHDIDLLRKRRLGTLARSLRRQDGRRGAALRQAAFAPDPRRASIGRLAAVERVRGVGATYFFKTAARGSWDVPYAHDSPTLQRIVAGLESEAFEIGLHPSYFGHDHARHLAEERDRLTRLTRTPPVSIRQHFLRYDPTTPRLQSAAGFSIDSTLGFSHHEGFRRGTCLPFRLFDVRANAPLDLWEVPLVAMDTTLFMHRRLSSDRAEAIIADLFAVCRRVGGCCTLLWHNTVYDEVDYPGQSAVFERTLDTALTRGAAVISVRQAIDATGERGRKGYG